MQSIINLFLAFLKVGAFSFGGAYSLIPIIEREVVENYRWLTKDEFMEVLGISQAIPGAISAKFATYTGYKVAGIIGVVVANIGNILPPVLLMLSLIGILFKIGHHPLTKNFIKGVKYGTFAMVLGFGVSMLLKTSFAVKGYIIAVLVFTAVAFLNFDPALTIVGAGILGIILFK